MKITLNAFLARAMEAKGYIVAKVESALNSAYNDGTKVDTEASPGTKMTGTSINETQGTFKSREATGTVRVGKLTDPLRLVNFNRALNDFHAKNGSPSAEITCAVIPANIVGWLDRTMKTSGKAPKVKAPKVTLPKRGLTPAAEESNGDHAKVGAGK